MTLRTRSRSRAAGRPGDREPRLRHLVLLVPILALACAADLLRDPQDAPPRLGVIIVVDQMRADYLDRFGHLFERGLARIMEEGLAFTDAHQDHANTVTAAGHASIVTGVPPARHGIVGNDFLDRLEERTVYCALDPDAPLVGVPEAPGRSPLRLRREGLADWLKAAHPEARVVSMAIKDRSAIMLGGRAPDGAYWYHEGAEGITTSEYYASELPEWVREFDAPARVASYWDVGWDRVAPLDVYEELAREDAFEPEGEGGPTAFPYRFEELYPEGTVEDPGPAYFDDFTYTPYADELILQLARAAVEAEQLGADEVPDLLLIGASAGDYIGHRWGPYSHEVLDYYLRLDGYLGDLFDFLDRAVGEGAWELVFSSDHGVAPAPEESSRRGETARRVSTREHATSVRALLTEALEEVDPWPRPRIRWLGGAYILPGPSGEELAGEDLRALREAIARRVAALDYVAGALTADEVLAADLWGTSLASLFRRSYDPERSPDVMYHIEPYHLIGGTPATHGSAHAYDTHVPLVFLGPGVADAGERGERVRTVDVAGTFAARLGIEAPVDLDGRILDVYR